MSDVADARASVRRARRHLLARAAADGAARGALVGAAAATAIWVVAWWASFEAGSWPLVVSAAGVVVGVVTALRRGVSLDVAALELDSAAGTEEAFISALTASSASPEIRALSADYAVSRCPPAAVSRAMPFRAPALASAAAAAAALVAALVLVPRGAAGERAHEQPRGTESRLGAEAVERGNSSTAVSPRERVDRLQDAVRREVDAASAPAAEAVRKDLGSVSDADLRSLAEALATRADKADAAQRALAALDRGDRASAVAALREALGGAPAVASADGTGTQTSDAPAGAGARGSAPWTAATWPLRYDRAVRRYLDEAATSEAQQK